MPVMMGVNWEDDPLFLYQYVTQNGIWYSNS